MSRSDTWEDLELVLFGALLLFWLSNWLSPIKAGTSISRSEAVLLGAFLLFWLSSWSVRTTSRSDLSDVREPIDNRESVLLGALLLLWLSETCVHSLFSLATWERTLSKGLEVMLSFSRKWLPTLSSSDVGEFVLATLTSKLGFEERFDARRRIGLGVRLAELESDLDLAVPRWGFVPDFIWIPLLDFRTPFRRRETVVSFEIGEPWDGAFWPEMSSSTSGRLSFDIISFRIDVFDIDFISYLQLSDELRRRCGSLCYARTVWIVLRYRYEFLVRDEVIGRILNNSYRNMDEHKLRKQSFLEPDFYLLVQSSYWQFCWCGRPTWFVMGWMNQSRVTTIGTLEARSIIKLNLRITVRSSLIAHVFELRN